MPVEWEKEVNSSHFKKTKQTNNCKHVLYTYLHMYLNLSLNWRSFC